MRGKNIFEELTVEELPETDNKLKSVSFEENEKRGPRKRSKRPKKIAGKNGELANIKEFSKLSISKKQIHDEQNTEQPDKNVNNVASIVHKKVTGSNNWAAFLEKTTQLGLINAKEKNELLLNVEVNDEKNTKVTNCVAIDCEMVGIGEGGKENMLARVSIVNSLGECLYDTFVKPTATVTDYRTAVSGVRPCDLVNAEKFSVVQKKVLELLRGKILVGHAVYNDLIVLKIRHPRHNVRDTTRFKKFYSIGSGTPSLKKLTSHFLKVDIQCGEHNSIQDAQAAMQLYMLYRKEWEAELKKRRHHQHTHHQPKKKSKPSHKPKRFGKNYKK